MVATIILLALTVTLFAAIFAFVTSFPSPPAQSSNQFAASLTYNSGASKITGINITHLAGPALPGNALIYLKSARSPGGCPFTAPAYVSKGISTLTWTLGEVWKGPFTSFPNATGAGCASYSGDSVPDNITVYVVSQGSLLYSVVLPGQNINVPPTILSTWTTPSPATVSSSFKVYTTVAGNLGGHKAYINLAGITSYAGSSSTVPMWFNSSQSAWQFNVTGSNTSATPAGTYYGVINVTGAYGQTAVSSVTITLVKSSGGSTTSPLSVAVVMIPQPPTLPTNASYFAAVITYTGSSSGLAVTTSFFVNQTPGGPFAVSSQKFVGQATTISGPSTVTVYSTPEPTLSNWLLNSTVEVQASATVSGGVGSATGTIVFSTSNLIQGQTWSTKSGFTLSTCRGTPSTTNCPILYWGVWNNWTYAPSVSGTEWLNYTVGTTHTVATYTVSVASLNVSGHYGGVNFAGAYWEPPTGSTGAYTLQLRATVTYKGVVIGYVYDTWTGTI